MTDHIVTVSLGAEGAKDRSYDIVIGDDVLARAGTLIAPILTNKRVGIVTDETVAELHLGALTQSLSAAGIDNRAYVLPSGESTKSFAQLESLMSDMLDAGYERADYLIAFGGGVIGDLTGFAASILKRGCGFIQIPTTLLAQVDSAVGGKTAINAPQGKNLIGAFYQPSLVLSDIGVLSTLPERQMKAGYAEVLKYGLLGDAPFFDWLEVNAAKVLSGDTDALSYAVAQSCRAKARIVAEDEFEHGRRALLNLGHTFGHALEAQAGYSGALLHGEAVAAGMAMAFGFSAAQSHCTGQDAQRVNAHMAAHNLTRFEDLPPSIAGDANILMHHMAQDKKNSGGKLTLILTRAIGEAFIDKNADADAVKAYIRVLIKDTL